MREEATSRKSERFFRSPNITRIILNIEIGGEGGRALEYLALIG